MRRGTTIGLWAGAFALFLAIGAATAPGRAAAGGPCMFDPASGQHKECANASMGACHHYTSTCEPKCMFDPSSQTYKECANASMGKCHHYTSPCTPAG